MTDAESQRVLAAHRAEIDAIDADIIALLAKRMAVVDRVIAAKRMHALPARIPERVEEVAGNVRRHAGAADVPADLAETVWRAMMDWVITYEDRQLNAVRDDGEGR